MVASNRMPEAGTIYIVTKRILFDKIKRYVHDDDWQLIDENTMVAGLSFNEVFGYLKKKGCDSVNKVGWYFQQFLKLAFCIDILLQRILSYLGLGHTSYLRASFLSGRATTLYNEKGVSPSIFQYFAAARLDWIRPRLNHLLPSI